MTHPPLLRRISPIPTTTRTLALCALLALTQGARAQLACSSDGQPAPSALLERFINADCDSCWTDTQTAQPGPGAVALDWILPGGQGDDAPMSAAARRDGLERLQALQHSAAVTTTLVRTQPRYNGTLALRVARGPAMGGYIGTSAELLNAPAGAYTTWLALVETIPAGADGTPVERNLVRNTLVLDWTASTGEYKEFRPLSVPDGAQPARMRLIGWVEDARARLVAAAQSVCVPDSE